MNPSTRLCHIKDNDIFKSYLINRKLDTTLDIFTDVYVLPKYIDLCQEAKRSLEVNNAGGKSEISEMFSIDYFSTFYNAHSIILEKEVDYWASYKMVDFICTIENQRVGISVSRAMGFPNETNFTQEMASNLLYGLIVARNCVDESHAFDKSILHIWCQSQRIANCLPVAFSNLNNDGYELNVEGCLLLQLTICSDYQIYSNKLNKISNT